jgi:hypothetical protein
MIIHLNHSTAIHRKQAAADALEAVVGAAFVSGGQKTAQEAIRAFKLPFTLLDRCEDMKHRKHTSFGRSLPPLPVGVSNQVNRSFGFHFEHSNFVTCALVSSFCTHDTAVED